MEQLIMQLHTHAAACGCCEKFSGNENTEQLLRLFLSPQGIEFCRKHNFPDITTFRTFRGEEALRLGIYIDAGRIVLDNPAQVALIGNTTAELRYDDPGKRHEIFMMHGAKAHIKASGYAVVFVNNGDCEVTSEAKDNAKIL